MAACVATLDPPYAPKPLFLARRVGHMLKPANLAGFLGRLGGIGLGFDIVRRFGFARFFAFFIIAFSHFGDPLCGRPSAHLMAARKGRP